MPRRLGWMTFLIVLSGFSTARAGLALSIPDQTLSLGSTANVVVTISGTPAQLNAITALNLVFDIMPDSMNMKVPTGLQFIAPPLTIPFNPATDPTLNDPNYLFAGRSADADFPATPFATVVAPSGSGGYTTQFNGQDSTDGTPITLTGTVYDLAVLQVQYVPAQLTNAGGDRFDISLDASSTYDTVTAAGLSFTPPAMGHVLVTAATNAVPEPMSATLTLAGLGLAAAIRRRRTTCTPGV